MIKRWTLHNFKSVAQADLRFAPLTLFAGANSSGKSTLLQSILLISQTLSSRVSTQTVLLNGYFTKLGQLDDLRPTGAENGNIQIGWEASILPQHQQAELGYLPAIPAFESVMGDITFGPSPTKSDKAAQLNPVIIESQISCLTREQGQKNSERSFIKLKRKPNTPAPVAEGTDADKVVQRTVDFDFVITMDDGAQEYLQDQLFGAVPVGTYMQHFVPLWLVVTFDKKEEVTKAIINAIFEPRSARQIAQHLSPAEVKLPQEIIATLKQRVPEVVTDRRLVSFSRKCH